MFTVNLVFGGFFVTKARESSSSDASSESTKVSIEGLEGSKSTVFTGLMFIILDSLLWIGTTVPSTAGPVEIFPV